MSARDLGNETAFPGQPRSGSGEPCGAFSNGLTKRELFAAMAMQGALTTAAAPCLVGMQGIEPAVAEQAVRLADALLAELAKDPAVSERDALARLSWDDIHRAMRSYGHTATQEAMRRALVSFLLKRDVHGLHPFTVADGHRPIEARP